MTAPWAKLAEPFPDSEVKQRPGAATWDHKPNCEGPRCRQTKDPSAHKQLSYVDAAAVIHRLNDAVTPGGWDFTSQVIPGTDIVHGTLTIGGVVRDDYGYPNGHDDAEPIKSASSDALKRCAALFGVGLHLRSDNTVSSDGRGSSSPARPPARPTVIPTVLPSGGMRVEVSEPEFPPNEFEEFAPIGVAKAGDMCDEHGEPWRGETGDLYHAVAGGVGPGKYHRHPGNTRKARP